MFVNDIQLYYNNQQIQFLGLSSLYGHDFPTYNIHMMSHLHMDYEDYGHLDNVSTFKFESYLGKLKKMLTSGYLPLQQIVARLHERSHCKVNFKEV